MRHLGIACEVYRFVACLSKGDYRHPQRFLVCLAGSSALHKPILGILEYRNTRDPPEGKLLPSLRELPQLVADHFLGDVDGEEGFPVVNHEFETDEIGDDGACS